MRITIRTIGNRGLYRQLAESYDSETTHRSLSAAIRRLRSITWNAREWKKSSGQWGGIRIIINGEVVDDESTAWLIDTTERSQENSYEVSHSDLRDVWLDTVLNYGGTS